MAPTNRPDVQRFDRQVTLVLPDVRGREQILKVHFRKVPLANDVKTCASGTTGFSGAANIVNSAAILAARRNMRMVCMRSLEEGRTRQVTRL